MKIKILKVAVLSEDSSISCDETTTVKIIEEGAGEFLEISQVVIPEAGKVGRIYINDLEEWDAIRKAIETLGFKKKTKQNITKNKNEFI